MLGCSTKRCSCLVLSALIPLICQSQVSVSTFHNDLLRTGQNTKETILRPSLVNANTFGKLFQVALDGKVDAQPLYLTGIRVGGRVRDVVYAATEHDSVYAFDANSGSILWQVSTLAAGETTSDARSCDQVTPEIGITGTPVIDRAAGPHGTIYLIAMSKDGSGNYYHRLHALDLTTGAEEFAGPKLVQATYPGTGANSSNGRVIFDAKQYKARPGLLLLNGTVYTSWGSHCDAYPYTGWIIGYDELTLQQVNVFNFAPNGEEAALWNSGGAPAVDAAGNIFVATANGTFDQTLTKAGFPTAADFGNSFLKLAVGVSRQITPVDYWTMYDSDTESNHDTDLGSGGIMLLPDQRDASGIIHHLAVGAGKDGNLYVVNRDNMGKYDPASDGTIYQQLTGALPGGVWGNPAFFDQWVYFGPVGSPLCSFEIANAKLTLASSTSHSFRFPGTTPSVSANGLTNGIVWVVENTNPAVLHAYDATNLGNELYNSNQAPSGRDQFGAGNKFIAATIANGQVFVGTTNSVAVFGLLPQLPYPGGQYAMANRFSTLVLEDPNSSTAPGTQMIQAAPASAASQQWTFTAAPSGYFTISNVASGLYLTDPGSSAVSGTSLLQAAADGSDSQLWQLSVSGSGYLVKNKASGLVIDNAPAGSKPGTLMELTTANGASTQTWLIY